ncbi:MAG: hypothetical protein JWR19_2549 [Pedosphaera sp.]|nr:hypothetical protein [Pedosphaera sp.]
MLRQNDESDGGWLRRFVSPPCHASLPLCSNGIIIAFDRERAKAEMMPENRVEKLCDLTRRSRRNRIVCAICHQRSRPGSCRLNNARNIQRLVADIEFVSQQPNLCELIAVRAVSLALRTKCDPLFPTRKLTQTTNGVLHGGNGVFVNRLTGAP